MKKVYIFLFVFFVLGRCVFAGDMQKNNSDIDDLKNEIEQLKLQFQEMKANYESKINQLETKIAGLQEASPKIESTQIAQVSKPAEGRFFQNFNPDISVIGDFTFHGTDKKDDEQYNQFKMRQAELAFSAPVDSYARADLFMHIEPDGEEWGIGLCEGYITLLELPVPGLQAKVGKFKANFGKVNRMHLHSLPWVDYPNMLTNFFGEEGMSQPGISASYLVPNPWDNYIELTLEAMNNHNSSVFAGSEGRDLVYIAHLKNFFDINEESAIELGGSFATGPNDDGHGKNRTNIEGIDLTYKWKPLKEGLYKSFVFQNEILFCQKDNVGDEELGVKQIDSWGVYSSAQYQFAKRWSVFGRYDFSEFPDSANNCDYAYSVGMTFNQSEYCFWRLQFKRTDRNYSKDSNEIWLQCNFGLGPHRKHEF